MQGHKQDGDLAAFVEAFGGTNRYILDYLLEAVLKQQTPALQSFLVETSILERMCGALCDAVRFASVELPDGLQSGAAILERLERANLFVMPLDDERRWYRYHHLFADLLNSIWEHSDRRGRFENCTAAPASGSRAKASWKRP
jgi:LuxR family maltose regulon positive regulatory protein